MTARWFDPHRLPVPPTGYVRAVELALVQVVIALVVAFGLNLAPTRSARSWPSRP